MSQSLSNIGVHFVYSTKNRRPFITEPVRPRLCEFSAGVFRRRNCPVIAVNCVEDHLHAYVNLSRTISASDLMRDVKEASSKWIKTQGAEFADFAWQSGYGAFSVSESNADEVREYIARQREHHARMSFEDEYRALLSRNGVEYDERYFLD